MNGKYYVLAKYTSKYGTILYCTKIKGEEFNIDMNNIYINTLYFKGKSEIKIDEIYEFEVIKGENGLNYCFI